MLENLSVTEAIERIRFSGLPFNSRQIIYSKLINEFWFFDKEDMDANIGIDDAFDSVYKNIKHNLFEDESYIGC